MIVQPVKIACPKNLTHLTTFLCISRYYMFQLTTHISNTLRNEQAKNTTMNDFARRTNIQQKLILFKNLHMLSCKGKYFRSYLFLVERRYILFFFSNESLLQFQKIPSVLLLSAIYFFFSFR